MVTENAKVLSTAPARCAFLHDVAALSETLSDLWLDPTRQQICGKFAENLDEVQLVIDGFNPDSAKAVTEVQLLMKTASLKADLAFIKAKLGFLPGAILQLKEAGLPLADSLEIVTDAQRWLNSVPGSKGLVFKEKLDQVVKKNQSLELLNKVNQVLQGEEVNLPPEMRPDAAASLKFCLIVSVDVERSFSQFKNILTDKRHGFTEGNLTKFILCNYFYTRQQNVRKQALKGHFGRKKLNIFSIL